MVEQEAVNFEVTGSSPVRGAIENTSVSAEVFSISRAGANRTASAVWFVGSRSVSEKLRFI